MYSRFGDYRYRLDVVDRLSLQPLSSEGKLSTGVYAFVYATGTKTLSTIYSNERRGTLANPITRAQFATDGCISFFAEAASVDVYVNHTDGSVSFHSGVTPSMHVLPLDRSGLSKTLVFPMVFNSGGTETDTGLDLPLGSVVHDVAVEVVAVDAGETVGIGLLSTETAGDADGFAALVSVATAGIPAMAAYTVGSNETYLSANYYGALLAAGSLGNDVATDVGSLARLRHFVTGANATSVVYLPSTSDTFTGYGYVHFWRHR